MSQLQSQITIVGLGPGAPEQITREAWDVLCESEEIWLRTAHHPVVSHLPQTLTLHAFDALYEEAETFSEVYESIVRRVLDLGRREEGVVYAVPGHPFVGEATVSKIVAEAKQQGISLRVVGGLSFVEPVMAALEVDALNGLQIADALEVMVQHHPPFNPDLPALVGQVYNRRVASGLKLTLMNQYPDEHEVVLVDAGGTAAQAVIRVPLYESDRQILGPLTSLYVPALSRVSSFEGFQETIARLRAPDGCPWDRKQTHQSLRTNLLEEAYEVLETLDEGDVEGLYEELGDLLLQIVLHTQIATEEGEFQMPDVIAAVDAKIKRRHPHVWGKVSVSDAEEVSTNWEAIKRGERETRGEGEKSLLDGVPSTLPALAQAYAYLSRAARVGFAPGDVEHTLRSIRLNLAEFKEADNGKDDAGWLGALLFDIVRLAHLLDIEPESALRASNARFARHFRRFEIALKKEETSPENLTPLARARLWKDTEGE
ncbi:MAG: nucleoside triphosphate pyrophosphohydrolase [Anaerolineae bacterium]